MAETQPKWERLAPKRVEQVIDALRKLTRTGARDYEPIPAKHAEEMLTIIRDAVSELEAAYVPYVGISEAPTPTVDEAPRPTAAPLAESPQPSINQLNDPHKIALFVGRVPKALLPVWAVHLCTRITDEFHESFKRQAKAQASGSVKDGAL